MACELDDQGAALSPLRLASASGISKATNLFLRQSSRRGWRRVAVSCIALAQIAVATSLVPADAVLDMAQFEPPVHVETPESTECPGHDGHLFCQIVRSLWATGAAPGIAVAGQSSAPIRIAQRCPDWPLPADASIWSSPGIPRAPPLT